MFELGAEVHEVDSQAVRVYSREKTLCDCLRLPEVVARDIALKALRRYLHEPGGRVNDLLKMAAECRVSKWMKPYVEALTA
jgi:predicted transcriptional regulator of viral defense system